MSISNKNIFMLFGVAALAACATLPAPRQIQNDWAIDRPFDSVWQATLETLAEMNFSLIEPTQKESGLISTELANFPEDQKTCWDCGKLAFTQFNQGHRGKITIFVKKIDEAQTGLKTVDNFEILFTDSVHESLTKSKLERAVQGDTLFARPCVSTGNWEDDFYARGQAKLK